MPALTGYDAIRYNQLVEFAITALALDMLYPRRGFVFLENQKVKP